MQAAGRLKYPLQAYEDRLQREIELIKQMRPEKAIIISTHILEEVDAVCTRAIVIASGRVVVDATPAALCEMHPSGKLDDVFRDLTQAPNLTQDPNLTQGRAA